MLPVLFRRLNEGLGLPRHWDVFDGLLDRVIGDESVNLNASAHRVDIREDANHFYVEAEVPGLTRDDIEVTLENGVLTLSGEKKTAVEETKENYHLRERRYGRFTRSFVLPSEVDDAKIQAALKDGILTITLTKRDEVKPRKINVDVA